MKHYTSIQSPRSIALLASVAVPLLLASAGAQELPEGYLRNPTVVPGLAPNMTFEEAPAVSHAYQVGFSTGDEVLSGLTDLAKAEGITSAQITGLGGLSTALLAFGDPSIGSFVFKLIPIDEKSELVSLVGTISMRGDEPNVHLHAVVALSDGTTRGGHVLELHVNPVAEVTILVTED
jgi:predicted DNA-binding protein with PD1-like motif